MKRMHYCCTHGRLQLASGVFFPSPHDSFCSLPFPVKPTGQKGLQRVCDICIVEGPVVLDDNGMYAAGPSPVAPSIIPPYPAPRSTSSTYNSDSAGRPPNETYAPRSSKASVLTNSAIAATSSKSRGGKDSRDHSTAVRMLFAEDEAAPKSTSGTTHSCTAGEGRGGSKTPCSSGGGVRTPNSGGARTPSGGGGCSRGSVRGHVCTPPRGNDSIGSGGRETDKTATEADTAGDSAVAALGEYDDRDTEVSLKITKVVRALFWGGQFARSWPLRSLELETFSQVV